MQQQQQTEEIASNQKALEVQKDEISRIQNYQVHQPNISANNQKQSIKIKLITWNLMGTLPSQATLNNLLNKQNLENIDILAIGTQQCQRTLFASFFCQSKQTWQGMLFESLHQHQLVRVLSHALQGLHLIVFVNKKCFNQITNKNINTLKKGCYGLVGNKGGICIEFRLKKQYFSFINVHLAAHHQEIQQRNESLIQVMNTLASENQQQVSFIFGDMNYRIDITKQQALSFNKKDFISLSKYIDKDQMLSQKKLKPFFSKYSQGAVDFPPTYKMKLTTNQYIQTRIPGWTDRIFFRNNEQLKLLKYYADHQIFGSDHRPVIGDFQFSIKSKSDNKIIKRKNRQENDESCLIF